MLGIILGICFIPNELNETATDKEIAELEQLDLESKTNDSNVSQSRFQITWYLLLTQKETFFALMCVICGIYNITFMDAWLSTDLLNVGMGESAAGNLKMF